MEEEIKNLCLRIRADEGAISDVNYNDLTTIELKYHLNILQTSVYPYLTQLVLAKHDKNMNADYVLSVVSTLEKLVY